MSRLVQIYYTRHFFVCQEVFRKKFNRLKKSRSEAARTYFARRADLQNAITLLRLRRMGKDESFFMQVILPGGTLTEDQWRSAWRAPDSLPALLRELRPVTREALRAALLSFSKVPALEKARDNELLR